MSFGTFTLIKNEIQWIGPHLCAWLPYVDEMIFYDGNSTDGTLEAIELIRSKHSQGYKITLFKNKDIINFDDHYTKMSNSCLHELDTDFAMFLHPDMFPNKGAENFKKLTGLAYITHKVSYGGNSMDDIYKFTNGRGQMWKDVMRLRNPDLGLHYFGSYGAANEDTYFSEITGDNHDFYGQDFSLYPYTVEDSGIWIDHFSDVRPVKRRYERMYRSLINQGMQATEAVKAAMLHPRVTLISDKTFNLQEVKMPQSYLNALEKYQTLCRENQCLVS